MLRPVIILSLFVALLLTACGGVRFLPYGEETPTGVGTGIPPIPETHTPTTEATGVRTGKSSPGSGIASPTESVVGTSAVLPTSETAEASPTPIVTIAPTFGAINPTEIVETFEPAPLTIEERKPYRLQPGTPAWLPNFIHLEAGCNWTGVAGQVFDLAGKPVISLVIEVGGELREAPIQSLSLTGVAPAYGPGGYEVYLGDQAIESSSALWLQLKDLSGKELADRVAFDTSSDCSRNLVMINFVETSFEIEVIEYFFPVFYNGLTGSVSIPTADREVGEAEMFSQFYFPIFFNRFLPESSDPAIP